MADSQPAVNDSVAQDSTAAASATTESTAPAAPDNFDSFDLDPADFQDGAADGDEGLDTTEESDDSASTDETDSTEAEETTDTTDSTEEKPAPAEERKQQLNTEIRDLVSQRNQLREQIKQETAMYYEARTPEQLLNEVNPETGTNYTALEARVQAQEEALALRDMNEQRAEAQLLIESESERVLRDMPIFRQFKEGTEAIDPTTGQITGEPNPEYQGALAQGAAQLLEQNYIRDPNTAQRDQNGNVIPGTGQIVGQHMSTYQLYKLINDATQLGTTNGELKGQQNAKKMAARADTVSSAGPKESKKDAFLESFDREFA